MRASLGALTLVLAAGSAALGQTAPKEPVLLDQWAEQFMGGDKIGYAHQRLLAQGKGFVKEEDTWAPIEGGVVTIHARTVTDPEGRILERTHTRTTGFGAVTQHFVRRDGVTRWSLKVRDLPERTGELKLPLHDTDVVGYLIARGRLKLGERTVRTPDLPKGAKERKLVAKREGSLTRLTYDDSQVDLNAEGRAVRLIHTKSVAELRFVSEREAKDMARTPPGPLPAGIKAGQATWHGLKIKRPGVGWLLMVPRAGASSDPLLLAHPNGTALVVGTMPLGLPESEQDRLQLATALMKHMNQDPQRMELSKPRVAKAWGVPAVRYDMRGEENGEPILGQAWLLRQTATQLVFVGLLHVKDRPAASAPLLAKARQALTLAPPKPTPLQAVAFRCGLRLKLPGSWKKSADKDGSISWVSAGGSHVKAWTEQSPATAQDTAQAWVELLAPKFKVRPTPAVSATKVGGREAWGAALPVTKSGLKLGVRLLVLDGDQGGELIMLMVVGGPGLGSETIDRILSSATWKF